MQDAHTIVAQAWNAIVRSVRPDPLGFRRHLEKVATALRVVSGAVPLRSWEGPLVARSDLCGAFQHALRHQNHRIRSAPVPWHRYVPVPVGEASVDFIRSAVGSRQSRGQCAASPTGGGYFRLVGTRTSRNKQIPSDRSIETDQAPLGWLGSRRAF